MKLREKYKRELEKKIDSLMIFTNTSELRYTKKDLIALGVVGTILLGFAIYACYTIWITDDKTKFDSIMCAVLLGGIVWEFAYFGAGMLYTNTKRAFFEAAYVILGYVGLIMGAFIGAWITLFELLARRANIYHLYKYFHAVILAIFYTVIMTMVLWEGTVWLESCFPEKFMPVDWYFGIWILFYMLLSLSFKICLKIWFRFLGIDSELVKMVAEEMQIPLYIFLIICMTIIWGAGDLNYSENEWMVGFLNASTVIVLWGSVRDKIGETNFED